MLSKRQAKIFFIVGTAFFSFFFIALTVDTVRQTPQRTKSANLTEEVKRGKLIWERNNCMGCHTILGEGAYYAPELTKVVQRRGPGWIRTFIKNPQAMFPGERKMVQYHFTESEITDIIAFLKWVGEIDTNGWPPDPDLKPATAPLVAAVKVDMSKAPAKYGEFCVACHMVGGKGGNVGPALDGVGNRLDPTYLNRWLANPTSVKPGTAMPKLPLSDKERADLVKFLSALK